MNDGLTGFLLGSAFTLAIMLFIVCPIISDKSKKQGQIDCINGKIYYHKVVQQDSSVTWEFVKK